MTKNWMVLTSLVALVGINLSAETKLAHQKRSFFKTIRDDFSFMRQKGFRRCSPQQQGRIATTVASLVLLPALGASVWFGMGRSNIRKPAPAGGVDNSQAEPQGKTGSHEPSGAAAPEPMDEEPDQPAAGSGSDGDVREPEQRDEEDKPEDPVNPITLVSTVSEEDAAVAALKADPCAEGETDEAYLQALGQLLVEGDEPDGSNAAEVDGALAAWDRMNAAAKQAEAASATP